MYFLKLFDDRLIDVFFQPLSDWISDRTGKSCFAVATVCALLHIGVDTVFEFHQTLLGKGEMIWYLIGVALFMWIAANTNRLDRNFSDIGVRSMSPWRPFVPHGIVRIVIMWLSMNEIMLVVILILLGAWVREPLAFLAAFTGRVLFISIVYFAACTPKPPKPQKEKVLAAEPQTT